jgi:hypothetical protein
MSDPHSIPSQGYQGSKNRTLPHHLASYMQGSLRHIVSLACRCLAPNLTDRRSVVRSQCSIFCVAHHPPLSPPDCNTLVFTCTSLLYITENYFALFCLCNEDNSLDREMQDSQRLAKGTWQCLGIIYKSAGLYSL